MPRKNLLSLFADFARYAGDAAVIQRRGYRREKMTYGELYANALFWSHALAGRGILPGDRVLLWGPNSSEWVACFWGILLRGGVVVPIDAAAAPDFVQRAIKDAGVKLILRDRQQLELPGAPPSMIINDFKDVLDNPATSTDAGVDLGDASTRSTVAEILYTSGTAEPRGVVLTHGNFLANLEPLERGIEEYRKYERWFHPLRFVSLVPLSHVFGQFMALFVPPLLGAGVVFESSSTPSEIIRTIKKERATALIAVPRMLDALLNAVLQKFGYLGRGNPFGNVYLDAETLPFLRRVWKFRRVHLWLGWKFWAFISGGAALAPFSERFFKRLGYAVVQGYGMTETASLISLNHPFRATEGSVGKILPGRDFKLAEDGEILVRGENVSSGYWAQGGVRPADQEGWLRTGDLGELDADGNLKFRGRKKSVIVTPAGLNVYPEDLEAQLHEEPGIRDSVVIPIEQDGNAEACAVLLPANLDNHTARASLMASEGCADAIYRANRGLAEYQRIRTWLIWPEPDFPRTSMGKPRVGEIAVRVRQLLAARKENMASPAAAATGPNPVDDLLHRFTAGKSVTPMASAASLESLSSLDRVELMSALESKFHVELNETAFANARTAADVERLLQQPNLQKTEYDYPRWTQREPIRWVRLVVYYVLVWPATQILGHPRIVGRENLRSLREPVLFVANHITRRADIGLILAALPPRHRHHLAAAMGGESLQNMRRPPRDWFFAKRWAYQLGYWLATLLFNVFPLPQFSGFRESFRFAGESVDRGYSVLVFPEGEVNNSEDGRMAPFRSGIGLLAENLGIPIVPMRLDGVWQMKREHRRLAHLGEITVRIGTPVRFAHGTPPEEVANHLESLVRSL
jgi:long-chain acyl-CoA synthetase